MITHLSTMQGNVVQKDMLTLGAFQTQYNFVFRLSPCRCGWRGRKQPERPSPCSGKVSSIEEGAEVSVSTAWETWGTVRRRVWGGARELSL